MTSLAIRILITGTLVVTAAYAQKPPATAPPQLSPKAAYDDAMHPLEATRHSIANWSTTEVDALKVAIAHAATDCAARDPNTFSGDALVDLARLCGLGQSWPAVVAATTLYISAATPSKPLLNQAYADRIDAQLHLKDEPSALASALAMLKTVPYDSLSAEAIDEAIDYMQFANTTDALTLDAARQPLLLAQLRAANAAAVPADPEGAKRVEGEAEKPAVPAAIAPATPPQSIHEFYADGIAYAALQQLANQPASASTVIAQLDAALPAPLIPDDDIPIAAARKRYTFLGRPLPKISMLESLSMPNKLPQLPANGAMTALLLFPDWCAQCVRLGPQLPQSVFLVEGREAYLYALLAETVKPHAKFTPNKDAPSPTPAPRDLLAETPTVVVPPSLLTQFAADDFPFLIIADVHGIIRVLQPVDVDALQSGGTIDTAIARVGANWPIKPPETPVSPTSTKP